MSVIRVEGVRKKFKIYHDKAGTLKEKIISLGQRQNYEERWVLNDINLEVEQGEVLGLIGQNGSGKSTLLKLMCGILYPNSGRVTVDGKISSLLELGAGFHPDMTGRENIYTNASIFGLSRDDIEDKLEEIIEFSEMGFFIDNPVRTYSSGMYMRLAFSIAINVNADILLIDEILAVGDANFQTKCFNKIQELKDLGITIVVVSHDLGSLRRICSKVYWLHEGVVYKSGEPHEICDEYLVETSMYHDMSPVTVNEHEDLLKNKDKQESEIIENTESNEKDLPDNNQRWGNGNIIIDKVVFRNSNNEESDKFITGEAFKADIHYEVNEAVEEPIVGVQFFGIDGTNCYGTHTGIDRVKLRLEKKGIVSFAVDNLSLVMGRYYVDVAITDINGVPCDYHNKMHVIDMISKIQDIGIFRIEHSWDVK